MNKFLDSLQSESFLVLDGAMGTMLFAAGLDRGASPEEWNVTHSEKIQEVHRRYFEAGSNVVLTNSFGGTSYRLKLHDLQDRVYEINKAAGENGRIAADEYARSNTDNSSRPVLVGGSMGPTGELMAPMGTLTFEDAKAAFAEQARGLTDGGVDMLWIETMSDLEEIKAAVAGARSVSNLPIVATMSFDTNGRTMMGVTAEQMSKTLGELDLAAIGANCGNNMPDTMAAVQTMHNILPDMPIVSKANAGMPRMGENGELIYDGSPDVMAGFSYHVNKQGARLIGACCGSSPDTIRTIRAALEGEIAEDKLIMPKKEDVAATNGAQKTRRSRRRRK